MLTTEESGAVAEDDTTVAGNEKISEERLSDTPTLTAEDPPKDESKLEDNSTAVSTPQKEDVNATENNNKTADDAEDTNDETKDNSNKAIVPLHRLMVDYKERKVQFEAEKLVQVEGSRKSARPKKAPQFFSTEQANALKPDVSKKRKTPEKSKMKGAAAVESKSKRRKRLLTEEQMDLKQGHQNNSVPDDSSHASAQSGQHVMVFPEQLMLLIQSKLAPDSIWWLPESEGKVIVLDVTWFTKDTVKNFFRGNPSSRITRSLKRWGFKRVHKDRFHEGVVAFMHPFFQRDKPELMQQMRYIGKKKEHKSTSAGSKFTELRPKPNCLASGSIDVATSMSHLAGGTKECHPETDSFQKRKEQVEREDLQFGWPQRANDPPPSVKIARLSWGRSSPDTITTKEDSSTCSSGRMTARHVNTSSVDSTKYSFIAPEPPDEATRGLNFPPRSAAEAKHSNTFPPNTREAKLPAPASNMRVHHATKQPTTCTQAPRYRTPDDGFGRSRGRPMPTATPTHASPQPVQGGMPPRHYVAERDDRLVRHAVANKTRQAHGRRPLHVPPHMSSMELPFRNEREFACYMKAAHEEELAMQHQIRILKQELERSTQRIMAKEEKRLASMNLAKEEEDARRKRLSDVLYSSGRSNAEAPGRSNTKAPGKGPPAPNTSMQSRGPSSRTDVTRNGAAMDPFAIPCQKAVPPNLGAYNSLGVGAPPPLSHQAAIGRNPSLANRELENLLLMEQYRR